VFNHTSKGKLALEWQSKVNDNYVYATIPDELKDENSDIFKKAVEAGKTVISATSDNAKVVDATSSVLDLFKDIFGSPKKN
jgi:glutamyl-tRNA reductase